MFLNHLMNCCYCTCTFLKFALKLTFSVWLSTHSESFRYLAVITIEWMLFWGLFSPVDHVWHQNAKFEARASVARPPPKTSTFLLFWCIYFFQVELRMVSAFLRIIILHSFTWLLRHKYTFLCLLCQVCFPSLFVWSTTAVSWPSLSVFGADAFNVHVFIVYIVYNCISTFFLAAALITVFITASVPQTATGTLCKLLFLYEIYNWRIKRKRKKKCLYAAQHPFIYFLR